MKKKKKKMTTTNKYPTDLTHSLLHFSIFLYARRENKVI